MGLFGKKDIGVPDIGSELEEAGTDDMLNDSEDDSEEEEAPVRETQSKSFFGKKKSANNKGVSQSTNISQSVIPAVSPKEIEQLNLKFEKLETRLLSVNEFIKGFSERFSNVNQQVGEVRSMNMSNEKSLAKISAEASRAVELVKEMKPENLRIDYQKMDVKVAMLNEKISANKDYSESLMKEIQEFRRSSQIFVGTDGLIKMNDEIKKDLIAVQKLSSKAKLHSDKTESIFMEVQRGFAASAKVDAIVNNLEKNYSGLKGDFEKIKAVNKKFVDNDKFQKLKVLVDGKLGAGESLLVEFNKVKSENERLADMIGKILVASEENKRKIVLTKGGSSAANEQKINSLLNVIDSLSKEVSLLKKKVYGVSPNKENLSNVSLGEVDCLKKVFNEIVLKKEQIDELLYNTKVESRDIFNKVSEGSVNRESLSTVDKKIVANLDLVETLFSEVRGILESIYVKVYEHVSNVDREKLLEISHNFEEDVSKGLSFEQQSLSLQSLAFSLKNFHVPSSFDFNSLL